MSHVARFGLSRLFYSTFMIPIDCLVFLVPQHWQIVWVFGGGPNWATAFSTAFWMKLSSSLPVVVLACFFPEANLTESVLLFVNCDCPSSLFPNRKNSPVVDVRVASISCGPFANFLTMSKVRRPRSVSEICFCALVCDIIRTLQRYECF